MPLSYHIITFGCQMNKNDSERCAYLLENIDAIETSDIQKANIIIINSCSVRQTAEDRVYGILRLMKEIDKENKKYVGVIGCMPGRDIKRKLLKTFKANFYDSTQNIPYLISDICNFFHIQKDIPTANHYLENPAKYSNAYSAFLPIMNGCNMYCSYCVVPMSRGKEISRNIDSVLKEIKILIGKGYKEICLLGQNVNSYNPKDTVNWSSDNPYQNNFAKLLYEIYKITPTNMLPRIYFTSPHPMNFHDDVIEALTLQNMMKFVHIPLQSGSNNVLKNMKRNYTKENFLDIINKIITKIPNITLSTDIIVGFPNETKEDFEETIKLYKNVKFDISYTAKYSPRSGTEAYEMTDNISCKEKKERWHILQNIMENITFEKNQMLLGKTAQTIITEKNDKYIIGHDQRMKTIWGKVKDYPDLNIGNMVEAPIKKSETWRLWI